MLIKQLLQQKYSHTNKVIKAAISIIVWLNFSLGSWIEYIQELVQN